jgi:type VI secretion system protein ImpH
LGFPPNQIENLSAAADSVRITPAFIGLLGNHGVLPLHYSERIARYERDGNDGGPRAFLDALSHRPVELFYEAWERQRPECMQPEFLAMLTALAGQHACDGLMDSETLAYYAAQIRSRAVTAQQMAGMYSEYFDVPFAVEQLVAEWSPLPAADQAQLGRANVGLDGGVMLGARICHCDARVRLRIGPLDRERYEDFLPGSSGALRLEAMLQQHCGVGMTWEIHLIQRAQDIRGACVDGSCRLGVNARLLTEPAMLDRDELMYLLRS